MTQLNSLKGGKVSAVGEWVNVFYTERFHVCFYVSGRRNRTKPAKDTHGTSSKDNHNTSNNGSMTSPSVTANQSTNNSADPNNVQSDNLSSANTTQPAIVTFISQICESCLRLEAEVKKFKLEAGHFKQIENELRQKVDACATVKSNLQAKNKENEELEKK